jgi:glycosyltransferase involved in cell wall biosynthesis
VKIVAATRLFNEDDIVEAFVRHNANFVDHLIFLDNGSVDRTIEILMHLKDEGFSTSLLRQKCCFFLESLQNTILYNTAARYSGADWVVFLDADEFLDTRKSDVAWRDRLSGLPGETACLKLNMINYQDSHLDNPAELVVPVRITRRWAEPHNVFKICLRGSLLDSAVVVDAGNHDAFMAGTAGIQRHRNGNCSCAFCPKVALAGHREGHDRPA